AGVTFVISVVDSVLVELLVDERVGLTETGAELTTGEAAVVEVSLEAVPAVIMAPLAEAAVEEAVLVVADRQM
ncbi:12081_t:CDS:2, partial [Acaulospora colombiana]